MTNKIRTRNIMALDNTLCVRVSKNGAIESIRGFHGVATSNLASDIRAIVESNPYPLKRK